VPKLRSSLKGKSHRGRIDRLGHILEDFLADEGQGIKALFNAPQCLPKFALVHYLRATPAIDLTAGVGAEGTKEKPAGAVKVVATPGAGTVKG
jgi:hypothetical protein